MKKSKLLNINRKMRKRRIRARIFGTAKRPRLSVFRSNRYSYVQLIDDDKRLTMASVSTRVLEKSKKGSKVNQAKELGKMIAEQAKKAGVKSVIFDKGEYKYHGRVKAVAEGAREGGLKF